MLHSVKTMSRTHGKSTKKTVGKYVGSELDLHGNRNRAPRDVVEVMGIEEWKMGKSWESQSCFVLTDLGGRDERREVRSYLAMATFPAPLLPSLLPVKEIFCRQREAC